MILLRERRDEHALLPLRLPGDVPVFVQLSLDAVEVMLQLADFEVILFLSGLEFSSEMVFFLLKLLQRKKGYKSSEFSDPPGSVCVLTGFCFVFGAS